VTNYTDKDDLETVLERKWVDWRIDEMKDELREECEEKVENKLGKQKELSEFV